MFSETMVRTLGSAVGISGLFSSISLDRVLGAASRALEVNTVSTSANFNHAVHKNVGAQHGSLGPVFHTGPFQAKALFED